MSLRPPIPPPISDELLFKNRHTCCICHEPRKHVQRHHIDGNKYNNEISNLAVLCTDCHSIVTSDSGLGIKYTIGEIYRYKSEWEDICANVEESNDENTPFEERYEKFIIGPDKHKIYEYGLDKDNEIVLSVLSSNIIQVAITDDEGYQGWLRSEELEAYELNEDVLEVKMSFIVPENGVYKILIINESDTEEEVSIDLSIWE